jgi:hypothetical protein
VVSRWIACLFVALCSTSVRAQQPFYTDDADVTPRGQVHVECFDEHDWLPASQMPHLQQNTFNDPSAIPQRPIGLGDLNFGLKYNVRQERDGSSSTRIHTRIECRGPDGRRGDRPRVRPRRRLDVRGGSEEFAAKVRRTREWRRSVSR